jgi:2-keto-myo-inositol isomerase
MRFAFNHILAPKLSLEAFSASAKALGATEIEIRNDLPDVVGTTPPEKVRAAAQAAGVSIITINALYPFNVWSNDLPSRATALAEYAQKCGAKAIVMCPLNNGERVPIAGAIEALKAFKPILQQRGLVGLVEPLGFPISSLRTKREAIAAIDAADGGDIYKLVHDTFHHHLADEKEYFADRTGLVHISGVDDPKVAVADMLDAHRVLIDDADRLQNIPQIRTLLSLGYAGPFSFEPFAAEVHALADPMAAANRSMDFVAKAIESAPVSRS